MPEDVMNRLIRMDTANSTDENRADIFLTDDHIKTGIVRKH
jgi:hypothetical protein